MSETKDDNATQSMANTPEEMIRILSDISFRKPKDLQREMEELREMHFNPLSFLEDKSKASRDYTDIKSSEIEVFANKLVDISKQSKQDGMLLWGRIQGTKYERMAQDLIEKELIECGVTDVRRDHFSCRNHYWTPTVNELSLISGNEIEKTISFSNAITPFSSAITPKEGVTGEFIYVGQGTAAELAGKDLNHKIVFIQGDFYAGGPLYTCVRTAYSRIASGMYGKPLAIVAWWQLPGAKQIATRVGAMGGGDGVGESLPWISIGYDDGLYIRKLLDRATPDSPVIGRVRVEGKIEDGTVRQSSNVYGFIPGTTGKYILLSFHCDSYFYGLHDNAGSAAAVLNAVKHYANRPLKERGHGVVVLSVGDHEHPGVGATDKFIEHNHEFVRDHLLLVIRPEKIGLISQVTEGPIRAKSNQGVPAMLLVSNMSPLIVDVYKQAIERYKLPAADFYYQDPAADEVNFHPPFCEFDDIDAITSGWALSGYNYHSTADYDLGLVSYELLERYAKSFIFTIDLLTDKTKEQLQQGSRDLPVESIYASKLFKLYYGNY